MKGFLLCIVLLLNVFLLPAQNDCYGELRAMGLRFLERQHYKEAINHFFAARYCLNKPAKDDLDDLIKQTQDRWVKALNDARLQARRLAAKADTLQSYLEGDKTYAIFLQTGKEKFKIGDFQSALQDFAIARFTKENREILGWINQVWQAMRAEWLTQQGHLDSAFVAYAKVNFLDSTDFRTQRLMQIQSSRTQWRRALGSRKLSAIDALDASGDEANGLFLYFFPKEIQGLSSIKSLKISKNHLLEMQPENWELLTKLSILLYLDLSENDLAEISVQNWQFLAKLNRLETLDLSYNQLNTIPAEVFQLTHLEELRLRGNQLIEMPDAIQKLNNLEILDLSENQMNELSTGIGSLVNLKILDLAGNKLSKLPLEMARLQRLEALDLSANGLFEIPESVAQLNNLKHLNLSHNDLYQLSPIIAHLSNLETLDLSYNQLSQLPDERWDFLGKLSNLQELTLLFNRLSAKDIEYIKHLLSAKCEIKY
ncbi:MAG: leucine-rich repeat domain-containing protein [Saprospiraceae bacterium]|nr:leucine-rich repeat domain-containing protein [Saprospiraceae bacterium]